MSGWTSKPDSSGDRVGAEGGRKMSERSDLSASEALFNRFIAPEPGNRPTPFYWWGGGDLHRDRLAHHLDLLAAGGIGGTIIGYSQHPNNELDHGDPAPFSDNWWELFAWFVEESDRRGMTVGLQDYGIIGGVLIDLGPRTSGLRAGSLVNITLDVIGPAEVTMQIAEDSIRSSELLSAKAWLSSPSSRLPGLVAGSPSNEPSWTLDGTTLSWQVPRGEWRLSAVVRRGGVIAGQPSEFDPMHPESGLGVITNFYEQFERRLGIHFGRAFTTIFQDELNLGLVMPMWNDDVERIVTARWNAPAAEAVHLLWHDGDGAVAFRAIYRDVVLQLLEDRYFRPIFEWHEQRGTRMLMDQLSRGDLRTGEKHYGDFMDAMRWYAGPGNDDPDLTSSRNIAAFKVSSSIAHLSDRPFVSNEAFHSSGWGITPAEVIAGANIGFAAGANQLILHGLNYTTNGGWWEWASPDFHFRQPWWRHSRELWQYFSRISQIVRFGHHVRDVAVIDPSQELVLAGNSVRSPELAHQLLQGLPLRGVDLDLVPPTELARAESADGRLTLGHGSYRAVVIPGIAVLRESTARVLRHFAAGGGIVLCWKTLPQETEDGTLSDEDRAGWTLVSGELDELLKQLRTRIDIDFQAEGRGLLTAHRQGDGLDLYLVVNGGDTAFDAKCSFRGTARGQHLEIWDAWRGERSTAASEQSPDGLRHSVRLTLAPGQSAIVCLVPGIESCPPASMATSVGQSTRLEGSWTVEIEPSLDNTFGDFGSQSGLIAGVESWFVEESQFEDGPWTLRQVDHALRFHMLGPVAAKSIASVERELASLTLSNLAALPKLDATDAEWRPYRLSLKQGIQGDPLLRDRMTGPHGLKGVPMEFLDPRALDDEPPAGSAYFFITTAATPDTSTLVSMIGRAASAIWVDGVPVGGPHLETAASFFAPWDLRDLSSEVMANLVETPESRARVLVRITVSANQPSRVGLALGGSRPSVPDPSASAWWQGPDPAADFEPVSAKLSPEGVWLRVTVPPGATSARVALAGEIVAAEQDGRSLNLDLDVAQPTGPSSSVATVALRPGNGATASSLTLNLRRPEHRTADAGLLLEPIRWEVGPAEVRLEPWQDWGLSDYSGSVRYRRSFVWRREVGEDAWLQLSGLVGTAEVAINGHPAGVLLWPSSRLPLGSILRRGDNSIEIVAANSLANFSRRLPSPYSGMQEPGGGFGEVWVG
jgi:hypothetical protein